MSKSPHSVLITQGEIKSRHLREPLEAAGITVHTIPLIEIQEIESPELQAALPDLSRFHWLLFTSSNAVRITAARAREMGNWPPSGVKIGVVGPGTAKSLLREGAKAEFVAADHRAEGLYKDLQTWEGDLNGRKIFLPLARIARPWLRRTLTEAGAEVVAPFIYETVPAESNRPALNALLRTDPPDVIALASSSAAQNLVDLVDSHDLLSPCAVAAIGPVTAETARKLDLKVRIVPQASDFSSLATAIRTYLSKTAAR